MINAATAIAAIEYLKDLGMKISSQNIYAGLKNVYWPGRFEIVAHEPLTILDGAHNLDSAQALVQTIQNLWPNKKVTLILGISSDKDKSSICQELNKIAGRVIWTKANHPRAGNISPDELRNFFPNKESLQTQSIDEALERAYENIDSEMIVITGSLFIVSEAREYIFARERKHVST